MVNQLQLLGTAEAAALLGISRQQVYNLRHADLLPTPVAVLSTGPVWDAEAIRQFAATWDRKPGRQQAKWRYIEVTYRLPDHPEDRWAGYLIEARSPKTALAEVRNTVLVEHPDATEITEFLQRTITEAKAAKIRAAIEARTWTGWEFSTEDPDD